MMSKADQRYFVELGDQLAMLYEDAPSARRVAMSAGLDVAKIAWEGAAVVFWQSVLAAARKSNDGLLALSQQVMLDYADNPEIIRLLARMPRTDWVAQGFADLREEVAGLRGEVKGMCQELSATREEVTGTREDIAGLKKNVIDGALSWAVGRSTTGSD